MSRKKHTIAQTRELKCTEELLPQVIARGWLYIYICLLGGVVNMFFFYVGFDIREVAHDYATTVSAYITNELKVLNSYDTWHGMYLYVSPVR